MRNISSVEAKRRQEANEWLIEYYKLHPVKAAINLKGLNDQMKRVKNKPNIPRYVPKDQHKLPPYKIRNPDKLFSSNDKQIPIKAPINKHLNRCPHSAGNPIRQAGQAVIKSQHYNVMPEWWG